MCTVISGETPIQCVSDRAKKLEETTSVRPPLVFLSAGVSSLRAATSDISMSSPIHSSSDHIPFAIETTLNESTASATPSTLVHNDHDAFHKDVAVVEVPEPDTEPPLLPGLLRNPDQAEMLKPSSPFDPPLVPAEPESSIRLPHSALNAAQPHSRFLATSCGPQSLPPLHVPHNTSFPAQISSSGISSKTLKPLGAFFDEFLETVRSATQKEHTTEVAPTSANRRTESFVLATPIIHKKRNNDKPSTSSVRMWRRPGLAKPFHDRIADVEESPRRFRSTDVALQTQPLVFFSASLAVVRCPFIRRFERISPTWRGTCMILLLRVIVELVNLMTNRVFPFTPMSSDLKAYLAEKYMSGPKADAILSRVAPQKKKKKRKTTAAATPSGSLVRDEDADWGDADKEEPDDVAEAVVASDRAFKKRKIKDDSGWQTIQGREKTPPIPADEQPMVVDGEQEETPFVGGLVTAKQLKKALPSTKTDTSTATADEIAMAQETVYRDATGRKIDTKLARAEAARKQREKEEKDAERMEWGKGVVQRKDEEKRKLELEKQKGKGFRRADDANLNEELKSKKLWNDPAAAFLSVYLICADDDPL